MKTKHLKMGDGRWKMVTPVLFLSAIFYLLSTTPCPAPLTATVRPGYTYSSNERPTTTTLNRLGNPTVEVTGTVDGTAGITAGTITGTLLSDSLPGTNLTFDGSSPRKLVIADAGVGTNQISTGIAGLGLGGGGGTALRVNVDTNTVTITNDVVTLNLTTFSNLVSILASNIAGYITTNFSVSATNRFVSYETTIATGLVLNTNHGLATTPSQVRCVVICKTADDGYAVGDEVDIAHVDSNSTDVPFAGGANATNVFITVHETADLLLAQKDSTSLGTFTASRWKFKVYAVP